MLTLSSTALMAATLSVEDFGKVVLMHTYVVVVRGLFQFKPFESIVRFGVPLLDNNETHRLFTLLCLTRIIDVSSSFLATLGAIALIPLVAGYLHWDAQFSQIAMFYSGVLIVTGTGTATGVLRLHNRFDALSIQLIIAPVTRFVGVAAGAYWHANLFVFMFVWALAMVSGNIYLMLRGHLELRRHLSGSIWRDQHLKNIFNVPADFWHFAFVVYGQTQVDLVTKHVNTLLAGIFLGPGAAGLLKVAKDFAKILATPAVLIRQVLFPDLTRAWHQGDDALKGNAYRFSVSAGLGGLVLVVLSIPFGGPLLGLIGAEYAQASLLLTLLLLGASVELCCAPLRSLSYAMGKAGSALKIYLMGMALYLGAFVVLIDVLGIEGPGVAGIISSSAVLIGLLIIVARDGSAKPT